MAVRAVGIWLETSSDAVMDVSPMIGNDIAGIDANRLDGVDNFEHPGDLRPAFDLEQDVAAGAHEGQGRERLSTLARAHYVDARRHRAIVVGGPTDKGEGADRRKADDAAMAIEHLLVILPAEPYPVFDALFPPCQFDQR